VIVRKCFPKVRKAQKKRIWKLKNLGIEEKGENNIHTRKHKKMQQEGGDQDVKMFLNDIEEDPELRANINLYKVSSMQL
jgi:nonsense-mediated mRNA decay protein 3